MKCLTVQTFKPHSALRTPHSALIVRRGVASVLAMMFLVLFGSLAAAMAVVAQGNMRTADSGVKLSRAMSAAETGMVFAQRRLAEEANRFVVEKGEIDDDYASDLWDGTYDQGQDGVVTINQPAGYVTGPGIVDALLDAHSNDQHYVNPSDQPFVNNFGTLFVPAVGLAITDDSAPDTTPAYFTIRYELLTAAPYVRVTSRGVDGDIARELQMDFRIDKKIEFAILSPSRIMIGKNVLIEGPLGSRYGLNAGELDGANGDPLILRSDFYFLDDALDAKLNNLYAKIIQYDVDGDSRLRPNHPAEVLGLNGDSTLVDYDGDEYVDDGDLFLAHYDGNNDKKVVYDSALAGLPGEYGSGDEDDKQLLRLIDLSNPDRDGDGVFGSAIDIALGYSDGMIDKRDQYAKVRGQVGFIVDRESWETPHGASYQTVVQGPVRAEIEVAPTIFEASEDEMREVTTEMFSDSQSWFADHANDTFAAQAGLPDEGPSTNPPGVVNTWEAVPYGASGAYDHYNRVIYKNRTFTNVRIPMGTNAVFEDCKFVGVTYVVTLEDCGDPNWNYAGARGPVENPPGVFTYVQNFTDEIPYATIQSTGEQVPDTRTKSNNLRFHNCTFLGSLSGNKPMGYTHWRNKIQMTGNTRFYIDENDPDLLVQGDVDDLMPLLNSISADDKAELAKSSILMPGWSIDVGNFLNEQDVDPSLTPKVKLKGTIIAGILDVRGTADVHGTLLMTHKPVAGEGPLFYGGLTDAFNTTIGYFGPADGDGEGTDPSSASFQGFGEITIRYNPDAKLPDGIPWPIRIDAAPETYVE